MRLFFLKKQFLFRSNATTNLTYFYYNFKTYHNFFKEGFLFDHVQKSFLNNFILVWITKGSLMFNFNIVNNLYLQMYYFYIFIPTLFKFSNLNVASFNHLFIRLLFIFLGAVDVFFIVLLLCV